ncbi:MAG: glycosyltransferase family 2 protein [Labrys sp. (in: a-proteobacteria)]
MDLTVVIPTYGLEGLLRTCLALLDAAITRTGIEAFRVVVVDNGSATPIQSDRLACRNLELLRFDRRSSFSRACNAGALRQPARFLLFLNNDVLLDSDALTEPLTLASEPSVGICGARLVFPDDRIQHCGVRFLRSDRTPHHEFHGWPTSSVSRVRRDFQAVAGAAMVVRGEVFERLGGFDEEYPFGFEDTDLCLRVRQLGLAVTCAQTIDSIHLESFSDKRPNRHQASRDLFFRRWAGRYLLDGEEGR